MTAPVTYSALQMSAIQELANIGTGTAATALSELIGRPVGIVVPVAEFVSLPEAADRVGPAEEPVFAVLTRLRGDMPGSVLLVVPVAAAEVLCTLLGTDAGSAMGESALAEIGNILTASYATAVLGLTGLVLEPDPPAVAMDMLGALVQSVLAGSVATSDAVLSLQTALTVEATACDLGFLWVPDDGSVAVLLQALGV